MVKQKSDYANYYANGTCADHGWLTRNQELFEMELREEMLRNGYIPVLDIPVSYTWEYDKATDLCKYRAIAKGLKVGRRRAAKSLGVMSKEGFIVNKDVSEVELIAA